MSELTFEQMLDESFISARQRTVTQREIARLKKTGENPALLAELERGYVYMGV